ncbi:MAG: DUF4097 family beta strand repeat-containing protein [Bryobacteraceae bacterium]
MRSRGSIAAPLILIAIGVLFLLHAISPNFPIADVVAQYWPYLLIAWGVIQLIEISIRALSGRPLPVSGISGGGWALVVLICFVGLATYEVRRSDNWWRRVGFEHGVQVFGEEHDYPVDSVRKTVGKTPHLVIETFRGDAKIEGNDGTELTVNGRKVIRALEPHEADRANQETPLDVVVDGNTVTVRCNQTKSGARAPVSTNLDISVPKGASIEATGTAGDFDVSSLSGDVDISSGNGGIRLQDIDGNVKVDTRHSDLVRCSAIRGAVTLRGHGSDVDLEKIAGQVTVNGEYNGTVSLRDVAKPVRVENMRTEMDVQQIAGEVRLDRGSLNVQNVVGPLRLTTHAKDVNVDGFSDGLELTVDKGDIDLKPSRIPLGRMVVHTRSGNIGLALPPSAAFALTASTDRGEIENEFGEALKQRTQGRGARLEGAIGSGPDLTLTTDRGTITVRKSSRDATPVKQPDALNHGQEAQIAFASKAPKQVFLSTLR